MASTASSATTTLGRVSPAVSVLPSPDSTTRSTPLESLPPGASVLLSPDYSARTTPGTCIRPGASVPPTLSGSPEQIEKPSAERQSTTAPWLTLASVERESGWILRILKDRGHYRALGFIRFSELVIESLGVSLRTAQEWMRVDEALDRLPLLAAAFEAGEITSGHVRLLSRVVTEESEAHWIDFARRVGVTKLAEAIESWRRHNEDSGAAGPSDRGPEVRPRVSGEESEEVSGQRVEVGSMETASPAGEPGCDAASKCPVVGLPGEEESAPEVFRLEIAAKAWQLAAWHGLVAFVRRLAGAALTAGECLEWALAESTAAVGMAGPEGEEDAGGMHGSAPATRPTGKDVTFENDEEHSSDHPRDPGECLHRVEFGGTPRAAAGLHGSARAIQTDNMGGVVRAAASLHGSGLLKRELASSPEDSRNPGAQDALCSPGSALDVTAIRSLHHRLQRLMATRQRLEADLAERLRYVSASRDYFVVHGFPSIETYARERYGLSPRRLYYLMALGGTLERLPALRRAFVTGRIHEGIIRCSGRAPDDLVWEMGCAPGLEPFRIYHGDTRIGGAAAI